MAKTRQVLVGEGDSLCVLHASVLNPPKGPDEYCFGVPRRRESEREIKTALEVLNELGLNLPSERIISYESPIQGDAEGLDDKYRDNARTFVHRFFVTLSERAQQAPPGSLSYYVDAHLELTANQASIVFLYRHPSSGRWLFAGDADETTFGRLISSGTDISAKFLKVPHHGSRGNMSQRTLENVNPDVAIISHKNRSFGRSRDTHPHHEIIDMLDRYGVRSYYTNSVIKKGKVVKPMAEGLQEDGLIEFA
jgi:hypothetical protein